MRGHIYVYMKTHIHVQHTLHSLGLQKTYIHVAHMYMYIVVTLAHVALVNLMGQNQVQLKSQHRAHS